MESGLFLDVVIRKGSSILELLSSEDKSLLIWRDTFFVLDLGLDVFDGVALFYIQGNGFTCQCFYEDLHFSLFVLVFYYYNLITETFAYKQTMK